MHPQAIICQRNRSCPSAGCATSLRLQFHCACSNGGATYRDQTCSHLQHVGACTRQPKVRHATSKPAASYSHSVISFQPDTDRSSRLSKCQAIPGAALTAFCLWGLQQMYSSQGRGSCTHGSFLDGNPHSYCFMTFLLGPLCHFKQGWVPLQPAVQSPVSAERMQPGDTAQSVVSIMEQTAAPAVAQLGGKQGLTTWRFPKVKPLPCSSSSRCHAPQARPSRPIWAPSLRFTCADNDNIGVVSPAQGLHLLAEGFSVILMGPALDVLLQRAEPAVLELILRSTAVCAHMRAAHKKQLVQLLGSQGITMHGRPHLKVITQ